MRKLALAEPKLLSIAFTALLFSCSAARAEPLKVAVIDTGISSDLIDAPFLCKEGHIDFTQTSIIDASGHGTHISGIIDQYAKNMLLDKGYSKEEIQLAKSDYCQVIIKFFNPGIKNSGDNMKKSIRHAIDVGARIINISAGGNEFDEMEMALIELALNRGIKVIAAAGNNGCELGKKCEVIIGGKHLEIDKATYYPAMYDSRLYVVGNLDSNLERAPSSNYGNIVNNWEIGTNVKSYSIYGDGVAIMSGTSQATAKTTGKLVRSMLDNRNPR